MTASTPMQTVKVSKVSLKGKPIDGSYPIIKLDDTTVVIKHPEHGNVRVSRSNTNLPAAAPATLSYDELVGEIRERFSTLERLINGIIEARQRSLIVSGKPGVGKTFTVERMLGQAFAAKRIRKYTQVKGTISAIGLYVLLWENRRAGDVIVLDDADAVFNSEDGCNILKAATDSGKKRTVSYMKEVAMLEANGIPKTFSYEGSIIVATNLDIEAEIASKSKSSAHMGAILNRALYLDLGLHSKQALMARVEDVCRTTPMLKDEGLSEAQIATLIGWMKDNQSTVRSLSLRTAQVLAGLMLSDPTTWKKDAKSTLLKASNR
jgi:hypothetical protein